MQLEQFILDSFLFFLYTRYQMFTKTKVLYFLLALLSLANGYVLGKLDFFGFLDGRHTISFSFFGLSILFSYLITIVIFLLDFSKVKNTAFMVGIATLSLMATFFLASAEIIPTVYLGLIYLAFLYYTYSEVRKRSLLFVHFSPKDIFFPVMKNALIFMLAFFAALSYFRTEKLVSSNRLFAPEILGPITKPIVILVNKELTRQFNTQLKKTGRKISPKEREQIVYIVLQQTVDSLQDNKTQTVFQIPKRDIDVHLTKIDGSGNINIKPMIDSLLPDISNVLTQSLSKYSLIAPLIVALLTFLLLQPFIIPFQLLEMLVTAALFRLLFMTHFLVKKKEMREIDIVSL
ncbi:MAG: hypothetical protein ACMG6E_03470 [Candidatus Roizmanbacteria bacterium]